MFVILGANGHVGSAVARTLLDRGEPVTVIVRSEEKAAHWHARGAEATVADIGDARSLRDALRRGRRAFLLNPPASPSADTDREERRTAASIVAALDGSGLEKVVAQSTYGAQPGDSCGDLAVLHEFEQALAAQPIPATVLRGAYYMSNWDPFLDAARAGTLPTLFPADLPIPMVAPDDLGGAAARLLREPVERTGLRFVEGPARYTPADVAAAFATALDRPVRVAVTPREGWVDAFRAQGFSDQAAGSYARMTAASMDGGFGAVNDPECGDVTLAAYITELVEQTKGKT